MFDWMHDKIFGASKSGMTSEDKKEVLDSFGEIKSAFKSLKEEALDALIQSKKALEAEKSAHASTKARYLKAQEELRDCFRRKNKEISSPTFAASMPKPEENK